MSAPNEFVPPTSHTFHPENVTPLVIQAAHTSSNFPVASNTNGATTHFNGNNYFPNSIGYDVTMLPFLHHNSQRPAHFNAFAHQKQAPSENPSKDELQIPTADGRSNVFNTETNNSSMQSVYWSRHSQLSPFGVLPHEISPEHIEESKSPYENVLNAHFSAHSLNNLGNHLTGQDCGDKKTHGIASSKSKDAVKKQFVPKQVNDVNKLQIPVNNAVYNQDDINFRNGVINHIGHVNIAKVDQIKLINPNYKNANKTESVESLQVTESVSIVPRDYRVFKSPTSFPNSSVPVVKSIGKPSKSYLPKQIVNNKTTHSTNQMMKNQGVSSNGSPLMQQKMSDFQGDSQSSPISLTSDDISDQRGQYSSSDVVSQNNAIKKSETDSSFHNVNLLHTNSVRHSPAPSPATSANYGEQQLQDMNCLADKSKVTSPFLKLPYPTVANMQNNVVISEGNRNRNPFGPLYIMYNNPINVAVQSTLLQKRQQEKQPPNNQPERQEIPHIQSSNQQKLVNIPHSESAPTNMIMSKPPLQNGLVGYPSVIMRTDRNYESEEKVDKLSRRMVWTGADRQVTPTISAPKLDKIIYPAKTEPNPVPVQNTLPDQHNLLLGLTDRQHSYFDTTPCPSQNISNVKCSPKSLAKNIYEENHRIHEQPPQQLLHQQIPQNDQIHHYQQYLTVNTANKQMPMNQPLPAVEQPATVGKTYSRKRKSSKTNNNNNVHMMENNRLINSDYPNRDPPPAHLNMYQQQLQTSNYMMDVSKIYPTNEQFYSQADLNSYNVNTIPPGMSHDANHHHQSVISSHGAATSRLSPSTSASPHHVRQVPPMSSPLPLSAYFSSFHPSANSHYPHSEFPATDTGQPYAASNDVPPTFVENTPVKLENEVYEGRIKVIVPNVEQEFEFLFDPSLPNYNQIACPAEEEVLFKKPSGKPTFCRKNIDFLASYIKFLENNCESTEKLTDGNSSNMKTWNRNKVVYQPVTPAEKEMLENVVPKEPPVKTTPKEPVTNFENDPRYYPLPKSSDKRRLCNSSSDEESYDTRQKKPRLAPNPKKSFIGEIEKKKAASKKEKKEKLEKRKEPKKNKREKEPAENVKSVKKKLEKLEKAKLKIEKLQQKVKKKKHKAEKLKPKMDKVIAEMKAIKNSVDTYTVEKVSDKDYQKSVVPRRKISERKAKDEVLFKTKNRNVIDSEDEPTDSDADPSWTLCDDDNENASKRRSTRIRSVRFKMNKTKTLDEYNEPNKQNFPVANFKIKKDSSSKKYNVPSLTPTELTTNVPSKIKNEMKLKAGQFLILKNQVNTKHPVLWRVKKGAKLQKFEYFEQGGRHLYRAVSEFLKLKDIDLQKYHEVETNLVEENKDRIVVELCDDIDIPTDAIIKGNFMKESLCYENQFAVYIQTLVSQALDSNFLSEIVKENDVYFLNNMKVIDEVTASYLSDLSAVVKWSNSSLDVLVKTWPFISIKNLRNESAKGVKTDCSSCKVTSARQTAIFYGQPYQRETLQGCSNSTIPSDIDKTINLCKPCAREMKLFNKIWHQKYQVFIECAKYVSKKKTDDTRKGTTDILNELLADAVWLSKLFYDIRNTWLQIWTIAQKAKVS